MHIQEVRSNRRLAKIPAHNLAGRIGSGSVRSGDDGAALRVNAALIQFRQLSEELVYAGVGRIDRLGLDGLGQGFEP